MDIRDIKTKISNTYENGKAFVKDHKDEIIITVGMTAITLTGGILIHKHVSVKDVSKYSRVVKRSAKTVMDAIENTVPSITCNPESFITASNKRTPKSPHLRKGFYRKLQKGHKVSLAKIDYAARNNMIIPEGYTYVIPTYIHKEVA